MDLKFGSFVIISSTVLFEIQLDLVKCKKSKSCSNSCSNRYLSLTSFMLDINSCYVKKRSPKEVLTIAIAPSHPVSIRIDANYLDLRIQNCDSKNNMNTVYGGPLGRGNKFQLCAWRLYFDNCHPESTRTSGLTVDRKGTPLLIDLLHFNRDKYKCLQDAIKAGGTLVYRTPVNISEPTNKKFPKFEKLLKQLTKSNPVYSTYGDASSWFFGDLGFYSYYYLQGQYSYMLAPDTDMKYNFGRAIVIKPKDNPSITAQQYKSLCDLKNIYNEPLKSEIPHQFVQYSPEVYDYNGKAVIKFVRYSKS